MTPPHAVVIYLNAILENTGPALYLVLKVFVITYQQIQVMNRLVHELCNRLEIRGLNR